MKKQSILINKFKFNPVDSSSDYLQIDNFLNVNFNNGVISSELNHDNLMKSILTTENYETYVSNNQNIILTITRFVPYSFFDEQEQQTKTRLFAINNNSSLYEFDFDNLTFNLVYQFSTTPNIVLHKNNLYFFDLSKCIIFESNTVPQIENLAQINSFAEKDFNLYFSVKTQPYTMYISDDTELKNISENLEQFDKIQTSFEDGEINKIINLKDKIFAITTHAILKYDEDNKLFSKLNTLNLFIYPKTIEAIDDNTYFYSSNGFYMFDGIDIERLFDNSQIIDKNAKSFHFNQNYYILSQTNEKILFRFDFDKKYFIPIYLDNLDDCFIYSTNTRFELCASLNNKNTYEIITLYNGDNDLLKKQFIKFKSTLLGSTKLKQISNIYIKSIGNFELTICSNLTKTTLSIKNNNTIFNNLSLSGTVFDIEISSNNYFKISSILIEFNEVGE